MSRSRLLFRRRQCTAAWSALPSIALILLCTAADVRAVRPAATAAPAKPAPATPAPAPASAKPAAPSPWAAWVEPDFPFFSSILDARRPGVAANNLTPRGLVLNLGHDCWVCFDTDLLRVAAVWRGPGVTPKALAPGSYHDPSRKTPGGQFPAPEPEGKLWLANGIWPGWQSGAHATFADPREPAPSREEVGRGPLPEAMGKFKAVRLVQGGAVLEYTAHGADVREFTTLSQYERRMIVERHIEVGPSPKPLFLVVGAKQKGGPNEAASSVSLSTRKGQPVSAMLNDPAMWIVRVPEHREPLSLCLSITDTPAAPMIATRAIPSAPPRPLWPQEVAAKITHSAAQDAYVVDDIALPLDNPWKRNVRLADIQFLADGTGVGVTLDGDVWLIRGLGENGRSARWKRFASGLHEPMSLAIRDGEIFVFDRNGIWRLRDTNGGGEADVHELFSNAFAQTADMREFPSTLRLAPGGEFVIAKGGQQNTTLGKHNGSVLRISADGRTATVLGYGLRQPNIGVNIRSGLVTASDQEGPYVPTTPLLVVRDRQYYGFLSELEPHEKYPAPIADPLTWIPHSVNPSGISQVWLFDAKMGALNDTLIHIGFNKPELFRVLMNNRTPKPQAAVVSITSAFDFPPLNGSVNPADGQLYVAGFQIFGFGTTATRLSGLARVRCTGAPCTLPRAVVPMQGGVLLRFDVPLDPARAADPANYSLSAFHYLRAHKPGSAIYKEDGKPGQDFLAVTGAHLSLDGRSVFLDVPNLKPVQQLRIGWSLGTTASVQSQPLKVGDSTPDAGRSLPVEGNACTTPYALAKFDPKAEGFGDMNAAPRAPGAHASAPASATEGRRIAQLFGCTACHSLDGTDMPRVGPTWKGLFGSDRDYVTPDKKKGRTVADATYLRESILAPGAKIAGDFDREENAMPNYAGALTEPQIESLILFIRSLK